MLLCDILCPIVIPCAIVFNCSNIVVIVVILPTNNGSQFYLNEHLKQMSRREQINLSYSDGLLKSRHKQIILYSSDYLFDIVYFPPVVYFISFRGVQLV